MTKANPEVEILSARSPRLFEAAVARAVELLRHVDADALTSGDATPFRTTLFRIHADEITGRVASTTV